MLISVYFGAQDYSVCTFNWKCYASLLVCHVQFHTNIHCASVFYATECTHFSVQLETEISYKHLTSAVPILALFFIW